MHAHRHTHTETHSTELQTVQKHTSVYTDLSLTHVIQYETIFIHKIGHHI